MKIGFYGYKGAGASTLYNALTGLEVPTGFVAGKNKVNLGSVKVPDERVDKLASFYNPQKTTWSELVFSDFPAVVNSEKQSLGNISEARALDILALVAGAFTDEFSQEKKNPVEELEALLEELIMVDLEQVDKYLQKTRKLPKNSFDPFVLKAMEKMAPHLEQGLSLRTLQLGKEELEHIRGFAFLSLKPALVAINVNEEELANPLSEAVLKVAEKHNVRPFLLSAKVEEEISRLEPEDQEMFLEDLGISKPLKDRFIREAYSLANLISFFTVGEDEVRSWAVEKGAKAPEAAGVIHSDLQKGFIRAQVFHYDDLIVANGDEKALKSTGKIRLEGKDYVVKDGDIMNIRFNV
ncbi:MAG: DUF933 domain-containing protein [Myxococcota bacterium]